MNAWRASELRQCLGFIRGARASLAAGDLPRAFRRHTLALRSLALARSFGGPCAVTATAGLSRALINLGDAIEDSLRPCPAPVEDLIKDVAAGIRVLQTRDGVELSDAQISERARNIVAALLGRVRIERIDDLCATSAQQIDGRN